MEEKNNINVSSPKEDRKSFFRYITSSKKARLGDGQLENNAEVIIQNKEMADELNYFFASVCTQPSA